MQNDKKNLIVELTFDFALKIVKYVELLEKIISMLLQDSC